MPKKALLKLESTEKPNISRSQLFHEVYFAKTGPPRPQSLWAVVNVMLVDWDGNFAHRTGVGKVIIGIWWEKRIERQEVILT